MTHRSTIRMAVTTESDPRRLGRKGGRRTLGMDGMDGIEGNPSMRELIFALKSSSAEAVVLATNLGSFSCESCRSTVGLS